MSRYMIESPHLSVHEKAHYAWLVGDTVTEALIMEAAGESVDPDLIEALRDRGIYDCADFEAIVKEHETREGELQDATCERDGAADALETIVGFLETLDKPLGKRTAIGIAQAIRAMLDEKGDRFTYAARRKFEDVLP